MIGVYACAFLPSHLPVAACIGPRVDGRHVFGAVVVTVAAAAAAAAAGRAVVKRGGVLRAVALQCFIRRAVRIRGR